MHARKQIVSPLRGEPAPHPAPCAISHVSPRKKSMRDLRLGILLGSLAQVRGLAASRAYDNDLRMSRAEACDRCGMPSDLVSKAAALSSLPMADPPTRREHTRRQQGTGAQPLRTKDSRRAWRGRHRSSRYRLWGSGQEEIDTKQSKPHAIDPARRSGSASFPDRYGALETGPFQTKPGHMALCERGDDCAGMVRS